MIDELLTARARAAPALLAAAVVGLQIAYPLVNGTARNELTVGIVAVFASTCVVHAAVTRGGPTALALLLISAVGGFAVEVIGVHTGFPFGSYAYSSALGPRLLGVPPVVGLAWTMLAWPAVVVGRRLSPHPLAQTLIGAWALAAADLFLDPQLVASRAWTWRPPFRHLPGVPTVPLSNYAGWLLVSMLMVAALRPLVGTGHDDTVPVALYLWLWAGWTLALAVFVPLPAAAGWGALGMGAVAVPVIVRLWAGLRR